MKRLLFSTLLVTLTLVLLMAALRAVGTTTSPSRSAVVLLGLTSCEPPCWNGIMPGETTVDQGEDILKGNKDTFDDVEVDENRVRLCWTFTDFSSWNACANRNRDFDQTIKRINLRSFHGSNLKLGDAINLLGTPKAIWPCLVGNRARVGVYFDNHVEVWAFDDHVRGRAKLKPDLPVRQILMHYPGDDLPYAFDLLRWHGFQTLPLNIACPTMP